MASYDSLSHIPTSYLEERVEGGAGSAVRHLRVGGENDEPAAEMGEMRWAEVRPSQSLRVGGRGADHAIQAKSKSRCNVGPPMKLTMARQAAEKWWHSTCRHVTCRDASRTRLGPRPEG